MSWFVDKLGPGPKRDDKRPGQPKAPGFVNQERAAQEAQYLKNHGGAAGAPAPRQQQQRSAAPQQQRAAAPQPAPEPDKKKKKGWF